jgi:L-lactate dehydrogenase (cytochrome)
LFDTGHCADELKGRLGVHPASISDYRELARRRLPHFLFEYVDGGSYAEVTLRRNVADLEALSLRQRVLRDISQLDLSTELFGTRYAMPIALAPVGMAGMCARRGEIQAARAAEQTGVPFCLSTVSVCPQAEVAQALARPFWFQLYIMRDREFMRDLIGEAIALKCSALVFTVDLPVFGARYRDMRSGLSGAPGLGRSLRRFAQIARHPGWAWDVGVHGRPHQLGNLAPVLEGSGGIEDYIGWIGRNLDPAINWKDLAWVRSLWPGPLIVKGILEADDARAAADLGVDGLVVSNHGGRQLDGALSAVRALPDIVAAVGDRLTILADGGVRSGLDVVRMLALGARGVLVGRPWVYALGARGGAGVTHVLELLAAEMRVAMALTGCTKIAEINTGILAHDR